MRWYMGVGLGQLTGFRCGHGGPHEGIGVLPGGGQSPLPASGDTGTEPSPRTAGISQCLVLFGFLIFFWLHPVARGILVPRPGIEPRPLAVKVRNPNHWTAREFPWPMF